MIRVKLVISMTNAGMKLSAVMISRICRLTEYSCCPSASVVRVIAGIDSGLLPCARMPGRLLRHGQRADQHQRGQQQNAQHQGLSL